MSRKCESKSSIRTGKKEVIILKILVLAKQIPKLEELVFQSDGRLQRQGIASEMSAYCRRAVAKGVELARMTEGHCTVASLGPPEAEDILREALAWGADDAVLLSDPIFAGSDTLATARAIAALVDMEGPFDLVLVGRSSLDSETGQVGPQLAELLGLPFASAVRSMKIDLPSRCIHVHCEQDDGWRDSVVSLPTVLAVAERLCAPAKVVPEIWKDISPSLVRRVTASDLLSKGPWGIAGSPTKVGAFKTVSTTREKIRVNASLSVQIEAMLSFISNIDLREPDPSQPRMKRVSEDFRSSSSPVIAVLFEPGRTEFSRRLLGCADELAESIEGRVVGISNSLEDPKLAWQWGADEIIEVRNCLVEEDFSSAVSTWANLRKPVIMLAPATYWGREVSSRVAARLESGLTGDAIALEIDAGRLIAWKSACGNNQKVAILTNSELQMATVRPGLLPAPLTRLGNGIAAASFVDAIAGNRIQIESAWKDDDWDKLERANVVIGVGAGVGTEEYSVIHELSLLFGAEVVGTRKVTDRGWLARSRQIGITGRTISPQLYVAIGLSGKLNHMVGVQNAGKILAINHNEDAPVFNHCDLGIVADWHEAIPMLIDALREEGLVNSHSQRETVI